MSIAIVLSMLITGLCAVFIIRSVLVLRYSDRALKMTSAAADRLITQMFDDTRVYPHGDAWREYYDLLKKFNYFKQVASLHKWTFKQVFSNYEKQLGELALLHNLTS